ncbi:hypothetical protein BJY01DRAFT_160279 [Aspergillus pseudoustus]|uniref:DUF7730 domain-containing protein n=1 Tax=Aspergillus pseudoustus TaxID=1810923 RepID=A0ABR4IBY1_9EURO
MPETGCIPASLRDNEHDRGLFKETRPSHIGPSLGFLDLPPEIRILIYRFVFGYRTIHVRQVHRRRWRYTICKCPHVESSGSEYTMGRIWAGDRMGWRHARPLCDFDDSKHSDDRARSPSFGGSGNNNSSISKNNQQWPGEEKLHLSLLQTCKQIYSEASAIPYSDNIYTFVLARAFEGFLEQRHRGLSMAQLAHIRNVCIFVQPRGYMMEGWNLLLGDEPACLDALTGLRRLQLAVGPQSRIVHLRLPLGHWMELRLVYGLLVFGKLGISDISVDVGLCDRDGEDDEEKVQGYAEMLEGTLRGPWKGVEKELKQLRSSYLKELGSS